jgi:uncharacterized protein YggU (UPF0235/DUF167 family)
MKIFIRARPNSSEIKIEKFGENRYLVFLKASAEDNEANIELLKVMGKYLGIPSTKIQIIAGATSKDKILEIVY